MEPVQGVEHASGPLTVFLSGRQDDLLPERDAAEAALLGRGYRVIRAETLPSVTHASREVVLAAVARADVYLGIYGARYGFMPDGRVSATELEYEEAQRLGKPTCVYVKDCDPEPAQAVFLARVQHFDHGHFRRSRFSSPAQLAGWIADDVANLAGELARDRYGATRRQLRRAYAVEVCRRFDYWRSRYVPLAARGGRHAAPADAPGVARRSDAFLPRGFRVRTASRAEAAVEARSFHDIRSAAAFAGDAVLLGEPGAGKTTSLWRLMLDAAESALQDRDARVPVLVPLGGFDGRISVADHVRGELAQAVITLEDGREQALWAHRRLAQALDHELERGGLALHFDGLNEVGAEWLARAVSRLTVFRRDHPGNRFLFTCRRADYVHRLPVAEIEVDELDEPRIRAFVTAYAPEHAERLLQQLYRAENRALFRLCANPYLLRLVLYLAGEHGRLPTNRAALFTEFVGALLRRERAAHPDRWVVAGAIARGPPRWAPLGEWAEQPANFGLDGLGSSELEAFLDSAAWVVAELGRLAYSMSASGEWGTRVPIDAIKGSVAVAQSVDRLVEIASGASLLDRSGDRLSFTHQLLQEYFAAMHLERAPESDPAARDWLRYEAWDETTLLRAGMARDPDRLIEELRGLDPFLAARCAGTRADELAEATTARLVADLAGLARDVYGPQRFEAISSLAATGSASAVAPLRELVAGAAHAADAANALQALGALGRPEAVATLLGMLEHDDGYLRVESALALGALGAREAIDPVLARVRAGDERLAEAAVPTLARICDQRDVGRLLQALQDGPSAVAARVLARLGVRDAIPALMARLPAANEREREVFAEALGQLRAREAWPLLLEQLRDRSPNFRIRGSAAEALIEMAEAGDVPTLLEWFRDDAEGFRAETACRALVRLGAREAIPLLCRDVAAPIAWRRKRAAEGIVALGGHEAVPTLLEMLLRAGPGDGPAIAEVLAKLGAREVIPHLVGALRAADRQPDGVYAGFELSRLWDRSDASALLEHLGTESWPLRYAAARSLGDLGIAEAIPSLIRHLDDPVDEVREAAARSLGLLGARDAIPALLARLLLEPPHRRDTFASALGILGAREAVPPLVELLADERWGVHWATVDALAHLDPAIASPFWVLQVILNDDDVRSCEEKLARHPAEALAALEPLLDHPDWWVRKRLAPMHERIRRGAGRPRPGRAQAAASARGALHAVADLATRALVHLPGWDEVRRCAAEALRRLGDPAGALTVLERTGSAASARLRHEVERARCLVDLGEDAAARALVTAAEPEDLDDPGVLAAQARLLERLEDTAGARRRYDRAIEIARPYGFHRHRAAFFIRHARYDDAEADCRRAAELEALSAHPSSSAANVDRHHPDTERQAGLLAAARGRFDDALAAFERAAQREPAGWSRFDLGIVRFALGADPARARQDIDAELARMELREHLDLAGADLDLVARACPNRPPIEELRRLVAHRSVVIASLQNAPPQT